ncbi:glycosyltransferase family 4 protein [Halosimplex sp. J119]
MHIGFVSHHPFPLNLGTATNEYVRKLCERGHRVSVMAIKANDQDYRDTEYGADIYRIDTKESSKILYRSKYALEAINELKTVDNDNEIDVIHMRAFPNTGLILDAVSWKDSPPVIADVRATGIGNSLFDAVTRFGIKIQHRMVDRTIVVDENVRDRIWGRDSDHIGIVPLGVSFDRFSPGQNPQLRDLLNINEDTFLFGYIGHLHESRNLEEMIKAFKKSECGKKCKLLIVGEGNGRDNLKTLANELGISDSVLFTGAVPFSDVPNYYKVLDCGLSYIPDKKQYRDQPPLKTVEYLATGLPVVATDTPGNRRFVTDDVNAIVTKPDVQAFSDGMREIFESNSKRKRLANTARSSVDEFRYSRIVTNSLLPEYKKAIEKNR